MNYVKSLLLAMMALSVATMTAAGVDSRAAQAKAIQFMNSLSGTRMMASGANVKLTHAEPSAVSAKANDYYVFNYDGGGYVIVSGDDRAEEILGYGSGYMDVDNLPENVAWWLGQYKQQMEWLIANPDAQVETTTQFMSTMRTATTVPMLMSSTWDQEEPYYNQCPKYNGEYCMTGCVATAMAQVMYYWKYPTSSSSISGYGGGYWGGMSVPALPATTFNYNLMLLSYCHWDWDNSVLVQDTYTDEQAQEVAKLGRYCGQAVEMNYSPDGSGAYTSDQLAAMKQFGYSQSAQYVQKSGWYSSSYTTAQWEAMIRTELDAGRPILYAANDPSAGGHAFICDGYNSDNKYHFNFGWYGTCDGWYVSTALNMIHRDGEELHFNTGHEMLTGVEPTSYCILTADDVNAGSGLFILGEEMPVEAQNVTLRTSYSTVNTFFGITNENGTTVYNTGNYTLNKNSFEQGSAVNGTITLPETLATGTYGLSFSYKYGDARAQLAASSTGKLQVVGHLAKYNEPFSISDVTTTINYLLQGEHPILNISDVTMLINHLLAQ